MMKKVLSALIVIALTVTVFSTAARADYYTGYTTLYYGMQNNEVVNLQIDLGRLGYFNASQTGYFGSITKQAVINYQRDHYLVTDEIVGHATARTIKADRIVQTAQYYLGTPYVWGGASPSGFDCSGLMYFIYSVKGVTIPRTAALQYGSGVAVSRSELRKGDLVFFSTYAPGPTHVGIYIGNGEFIHASTGQGKVVVSSLDNPYFAPRYIGARRYLN